MKRAYVITMVLISCLPFGSAHAAQPLGCLIEPEFVAEVGTPVVGVIESVLVERGDTVKKGQAIAVLQSEVERAALDVARTKAQSQAEVRAAAANLDLARQRKARAEGLSSRKVISQEDIDAARTEARVTEQRLDQAREAQRIWQDELRLAEAKLDQRTIRSPVDGVIADRYLSAGERIEEKPLARVAKIDPLRVEVVVPASVYGRIQLGTVASVMLELPNAQPVTAKVTLVDKLIDGASNTFRVRLELPNPSHELPAGLRCQADLGLGAENVAASGGGSGGTVLMTSATQSSTVEQGRPAMNLARQR